EPDLPLLVLPDGWVASLREAQPELPAARRLRYADLGLSANSAALLVDDPELAAYFDATVRSGAEPKTVANWVGGELLAKLEGAPIGDSPLAPEQLAELIGMIADGTVSGRAAKQVFSTVWAEGGSPRAIAERDGHRQVSDTSVLEAAVVEVIASSPKQLAQFRSGKVSLKGYFVGQVMKKTRGQANPKLVGEILDRQLAATSEALPE
ncbi:MAG: Asp-tRNA(Asn)/Glu-tRNA(Gln) amidotransferase GatCAB subunit B, partial [Mariprofundus sp.]|nr:Asp-tRNA(Asn)/Glu-tRNA(Gln) amidotransferase GatCAB subunit B [Mariprofundus sp.]